MKKVYVAHPYNEEPANKERVENLIKTLTLENDNIIYISPIHLFGYMYSTISYEKGMEFCLEILKSCDELLIADNEYIKNSRGCNIELEFAKKNNIPVKYWGEKEYNIVNNEYQINGEKITIEDISVYEKKMGYLKNKIFEDSSFYVVYDVINNQLLKCETKKFLFEIISNRKNTFRYKKFNNIDESIEWINNNFQDIKKISKKDIEIIKELEKKYSLLEENSIFCYSTTFVENAYFNISNLNGERVLKNFELFKDKTIVNGRYKDCYVFKTNNSPLYNDLYSVGVALKYAILNDIKKVYLSKDFTNKLLNEEDLSQIFNLSDGTQKILKRVKALLKEFLEKNINYVKENFNDEGYELILIPKEINPANCFRIPIVNKWKLWKKKRIEIEELKNFEIEKELEKREIIIQGKIF